MSVNKVSKIFLSYKRLFAVFVKRRFACVNVTISLYRLTENRVFIRCKSGKKAEKMSSGVFTKVKNNVIL